MMRDARQGDTATTRRALALFAGCLVAFAPGLHAATYKWVDEKGVVHYTDKIPPEAINKANVQLDKQGVTVRKTEPALTPQQIKAKAEEEERQRLLAKEREIVERRDRALLSTYTMESEIDLARRRAVSTIEQQIHSSSAYSAQLGKRKEELDAKKAALGSQPVPPILERELASISVELAKQADLVAVKQKEVILVNARYDADKKRWRELRAATEAQMNAAARAQEAAAQGTGAQPTSARK
ncbi:MAG: DUF4124 domain-containing protein [Burkholderiales bacterium]|nr:DUF4124 domain-containing protein [Burkholderiales bacterium]